MVPDVLLQIAARQKHEVGRGRIGILSNGSAVAHHQIQARLQFDGHLAVGIGLSLHIRHKGIRPDIALQHRGKSIPAAGNKRAVILSLYDLQCLGVLRLHDQDLIHFIRKHLVQHAQDKGIPLGELVQIGEQLGTRQAAVSGQHTVRALAAHRQARPFQMADRRLKNEFLRPVENRERNIDGGNLDISHRAVSAYVEKLRVLRCLGIRQHKILGSVRHSGIVAPGSFQNFLILGLVHFLHTFCICRDCLGLVERVYVIAHRRIEQQAKTGKEHQNKKQCADMLFHWPRPRLFRQRGAKPCIVFCRSMKRR